MNFAVSFPLTVDKHFTRQGIMFIIAVLHVAAFYGHVEIVDIILQLGALVNGADYLNQTPLHIACKHGHQSITVSSLCVC